MVKQRIAIVGLGLIGGSLARRLVNAGCEVIAWNHNDRPYETAKADGIRCVSTLAALAGTKPDVLVLCNPLKAMPQILGALKPLIDTDITTLTDVGSVKAMVREQVKAVGLEHCYVGAHPMAGTQFSGYAHSRADLFQDAPLVLVPPAVDDALKLELLGQVREMVRPLGFGKFSVTSAAEHDRVIAFTSQLAHVVSNAYVKSPTAQVHHGFSAGSYRDLTRVAHLNPQMWSELMIDDANALAFEIDHLIESLGAYSRALKDRDQRYLENLLAEGDRIKRALDDEASH